MTPEMADVGGWFRTAKDGVTLSSGAWCPSTGGHGRVSEGPDLAAGLDAFDASLHPNDTPYYFFVTDVEYTHYYAVAYQQHLANIEKAKAVNAKHGINGLVTG